jgi:polyisoprenoid-binding protein YceI
MKTICLLFVLCPLISMGQKIVSNKSTVTFFSDAAIEDITATNQKSSGIIDLSKSEFAFAIPIKDFQFAKSLMKEHFNEKYMETEKFPKSTFLGKMENFSNDKEEQEILADGKLTIHGITRDVKIPATIKKSGTGYKVNSKFIVKLEDYGIAIPQLLFQNIAESVEVTVDFNFTPQ